MRLLFTISAIVLGHLVFCQELKELRHTKTTQFKYDFYVSLNNKKLRHQDTLHYFWFKSQKLHVTQGNTDGYPLHGKFTKFYHSGQLAESGQFEKGLKDGEWKRWFESGNLESIYHYKEGLLTGEYTLYNDKGDVRESGKIRKGEKDPDAHKSRKEKKERNWGVQKVSEAKEAVKEEKRKQREKDKIARKKRREDEGNFLQRFFNKVRTKKAERQRKKKS